MSSKGGDACGCFPSGRHYPGIAHLLKTSVRGVADEFAADMPWDEIPIAMLDVETTGRDSAVDRVVELGIVVGRGDTILRRHNWLIQPGIRMPAEAQAVHGISDEDLKDAPTFAQVAKEIADALIGTIPAAYNANFDRGFLHAECTRAKHVRRDVPALRPEVTWLDPLVWARAIQASERSRTLGDVAARLGISLTNAHRASDDAEAALKVLYALAREPGGTIVKNGMPRAYGALVAEQRRIAMAQADARRMWRS
jgi:DNA polymerase-3 subunit epsilon